MVKRGRRTTVDPFQARKYVQVARSLRESAEALDTIAEKGDPFGNAMAICVIHSAITYADAVAIAYAGFKSAEGEHEKAVDTLKAALGHRADPVHVKSLLKWRSLSSSRSGRRNCTSSGHRP